MDSSVSSPVENKPKAVDAFTEMMIERIAVQRPYFAFDSLFQTSDSEWDIWGDFEPEQPMGSELGPLAAAEAGRHLAILGSCAAALRQDPGQRVYYLATDAVWIRRDKSLLAAREPALKARARVSGCSQRTVEATTELLQAGVVIGGLNVRYHVLPEGVFTKKFAAHCDVVPVQVAGSPYLRALQLEVLATGRGERAARSERFSAAQCAGHFPGYPMWPVALVIYGLSQVMADLLAEEMKRPCRFTMVHAKVQALRLVPATEQLTFCARLVSTFGDAQACRMDCCALLGDEVIARLEALLVLE